MSYLQVYPITASACTGQPNPDLLIQAAAVLSSLSITCSTIALGQLAYAFQGEGLSLAERKKLVLDSIESSKIAGEFGVKTLGLIELAKKIKAHHQPGPLSPPNPVLVNMLIELPAADFMIGTMMALGLHALEQKNAEKRSQEIQVKKEILEEELQSLKDAQTNN